MRGRPAPKPPQAIPVPEGATETTPDGVWQVDETGHPFVRIGGRQVPLLEDEAGYWHPVVHRRSKTVMKRYPSNGRPDLNPVRHYAKLWGVSRRQAAERLALLLADAAQGE